MDDRQLRAVEGHPLTRADDPSASKARDEFLRLSKYLDDEDLSEEFKSLMRPRPAMTALYLASSWMLIALAWLAVTRVSLVLLPVALVLIGSRQRALVNNLHDASHGNVTKWSLPLLGQWLFALTHHLAPRVPMANLAAAHRLLSRMKEYARGHHCDGFLLGKLLGDPELGSRSIGHERRHE